MSLKSIYSEIKRMTGVDEGVPFEGLDTKIIPLVTALNYKGYKTIMSCEGHNNRGCPYPWVDLSSTENVPRLTKELDVYNPQSSIAWGLHESHMDTKHKKIVYRLMPKNAIYGELSEWQKENMAQKQLEDLKQYSQKNIVLEDLQSNANELVNFLMNGT